MTRLPEPDPTLLPVAWDAPAPVRAFTTLRSGGVSAGPWGLADGAAGGWNLGSRCGDEPAAVAENRRRLRERVPSEPIWLEQVHGTDVLDADRFAGAAGGNAEPRADAAVTGARGRVLVILTADCIPVFFADRDGRAVGLAHAGWRGLAEGVLERTVAALRAQRAHSRWLAHLGPAIGPAAFEVGDDVRTAFVVRDAAAAASFVPTGGAGKWWCDLYGLARLRLHQAGIDDVTGGELCTVADPVRFYSHRRDRTTGRIASVIWLA